MGNVSKLFNYPITEASKFIDISSKLGVVALLEEILAT